MPHFYFQITHDQKPSAEPDALELRDVDAAWHEATIAAAELLRDVDGSLGVGTDWKIEVKDELGVVIRTITISARGRK